MIVSTRACHVLASARVWLNSKAAREIKLFFSSCLFLAVCIVVMSGTSAGHPPQQPDEPKIPTKEYAQTYSQSFKGSDVSPDGWRFISRLSEERVQFEKAGLRITLPPGGPDTGQSVGIRSAFGVKGDFEITLSFEALKDPDPADVGKSGTRFGLSLNLDTPLLDTPQAEVATLNRSMATKGFSTWARTRYRPKPFSHSFPTPATTGQFRMVRSGEELYYLASVGADLPLVFLQKYRFGAEDLQRVGISASTGGEKATIDMRVTDFRIRADGIPGAPESDAAEQPPNQVTRALEDGKGWLIVMALIGGARDRRAGHAGVRFARAQRRCETRNGRGADFRYIRVSAMRQGPQNQGGNGRQESEMPRLRSGGACPGNRGGPGNLAER